MIVGKGTDSRILGFISTILGHSKGASPAHLPEFPLPSTHPQCLTQMPSPATPKMISQTDGEESYR
ncbi:1236_t:CDS:1, partial [Acaulospora colombiana]